MDVIEEAEDLTEAVARKLGFTWITHHETSAATATAVPTIPTTQAIPTEEHMQLSQIAADIQGAIEGADEWVKQITETHLPNVLALAAKYEASPIVQALEGALLPPAVEQSIAATISELAKLYPAQAAPVQAVQPPAA